MLVDCRIAHEPWVLTRDECGALPAIWNAIIGPSALFSVRAVGGVRAPQTMLTFDVGPSLTSGAWLSAVTRRKVWSVSPGSEGT